MSRLTFHCVPLTILSPIITSPPHIIFGICSSPMLSGVNSFLARFSWCPRTLKESWGMNVWRNPSPLFMHIYSRLFSPELLVLRQRWSIDVPELDWKDIWDFPFTIFVSLKDHLIRFKIVHRTYWLHKMGHFHSLECWRCASPRWLYSHILVLPCNKCVLDAGAFCN